MIYKRTQWLESGRGREKGAKGKEKGNGSQEAPS
jgi:hypothetical protein